MRARLNLYLDPKLNQRLDALAQGGGSKSAILNDALRAYLGQRGKKDVEDALSVRLEKLSDHLARIERNQHVTIESLALFIRFELGNAAPLGQRDQAAAAALGRERFEAFIAQVGKRIAESKSVGRDVLARAANPIDAPQMQMAAE